LAHSFSLAAERETWPLLAVWMSSYITANNGNRRMTRVTRESIYDMKEGIEMGTWLAESLGIVLKHY